MEKNNVEEKFVVTVSERLVRTVEVVAASREEAYDRVRSMYKNEEIILDSEDFFDYDIEVE